ncbi:MAG: hypothetical protein ACOYOO_03390 [Saprospiraceae bacterium]
MHQTCTPDLFVKWLYGELTPEEAREAKAIIQHDVLMREEFQALQKAYRMLPKATFSASPKTIEAVLRYSKQSRGQNT